MKTPSHPLSALVRNEPGVLARVSGLLARRGFNIDSLTVAETHDPAVSRLTIVLRGDQATVEQAVKQLARLVEVLKVRDLSDCPRVELECLLVKVRVKPEQHPRLFDLLASFPADLMEAGPQAMIIAAVGRPDRLDDLVARLKPFGVLDLARTGAVAMARGQTGLGHGQARPVGLPRTPGINWLPGHAAEQFGPPAN